MNCNFKRGFAVPSKGASPHGYGESLHAECVLFLNANATINTLAKVCNMHLGSLQHT